MQVERANTMSSPYARKRAMLQEHHAFKPGDVLQFSYGHDVSSEFAICIGCRPESPKIYVFVRGKIGQHYAKYYKKI
jgi:hypothetical protein